MSDLMKIFRKKSKLLFFGIIVPEHFKSEVIFIHDEIHIFIPTFLLIIAHTLFNNNKQKVISLLQDCIKLYSTIIFHGFNLLTDQRHGADWEQQLEEGVKTMTDFISALKSEIKERNGVIEMLDQADSFYDNQRGEAKIVCNVSVIILR